MSFANRFEFASGTMISNTDWSMSIIRLHNGYQMQVPNELLCRVQNLRGLMDFLRGADSREIINCRKRMRYQGDDEAAVEIMEMALDVLRGNYRRDQEAGMQYLERQQREMVTAPTPKCKSCGQDYHESKFDWRGRCDNTVAKFWDKVRVLHYHRALQKRHSNEA